MILYSPEADASCPPQGTDCSEAYFDTPCGEADWNANVEDPANPGQFNPNWGCYDEVMDRLNAEETAPNATVGVDSALPNNVYDSGGLSSTHLFETDAVTLVDEIQPVQASTDYKSLATDTIDLRSYEKDLYEVPGDEIASREIKSCREFAFHAWQDWAELYDAAIQESWTTRDYFDEVYGTRFHIARPQSPSAPWGPSNPMVHVAEDRDGVTISSGIPYRPRFKNAVEAWDPVAEEPVEDPPRIYPTLDDHYERGQYAIAQGWNFDALDDLWHRQKRLLAAIAAYHMAEKAKMDAILEDLVRFGNTPVQAWNIFDQQFGAVHPSVESLTPARCRYNDLVRLAAATSQEGRREAVINETRGGYPVPDNVANGGDLETIPDGFDRDILLTRPGDWGDAQFDPYYATNGPLPPRPGTVLDQFGHQPFPTGNEVCDLTEELTRLGLNPYDFNFTPLQFRLDQAQTAKNQARQQADAIYDDIESVCPKGTAPTPCDWAPAAFMESIVGYFDGSVNKTEQGCLQRTNDLLDTVLLPDAPECPDLTPVQTLPTCSAHPGFTPSTSPTRSAPDSPPAHSLRTFFSGYPCDLMLQFLDGNHASYTCPEELPPPNALADFNEFWDKQYTKDVTTFRDLYADMDKYAHIKEWVLRVGIGKMARKVADKLHFEKEGKSTFFQSGGQASSRASGPGEGSFKTQYSTGAQYATVVNDNYEEAFGKGVGASKMSIKYDSKMLGHGGNIVDFNADLGADGDTGLFNKQNSLDFMTDAGEVETSGTMPTTFSYKHTFGAELSFAAAVLGGNKPEVKLACLGPVKLKIEADIVAYVRATLKFGFITNQTELLSQGGLRGNELEFSINTGCEAFVALVLDLLFVKAGIKGGLTFVDGAFVVSVDDERRFETFNSQPEANAFLPNLWFLGGCSITNGATECSDLSLKQRGGGPSNGVIVTRAVWAVRLELKAFQFFLKAFAQVGVPPFAFTIEKDLARTSGLKVSTETDRQESTDMALISAVACDDALDITPETWNRQDCTTTGP